MLKHSLLFVFALTLPLTFGCKSKSNVLAKVQGKDVTQQELDNYLRVKRIPPSDAKRRDAAFDELLQREALASLAEKQPGFDKAGIDAELADMRRELLISRYLDHYLDEKVTDAAVKAYYDAHVKDYEQRKVHAAHILVRTNSRMTDAEKAAKLTAATELKAKLDAGANFEDLARTASDDKISGSQGGDLGWLREGSIDPEFSRRAFSATPGSVSEPFATAFGYHVLKVLEPPSVVRRPYQGVLGEIRYQLRAEAKEAELKRLKGLVKIEKKNPYKLDPKAAAAPSARGSASASPSPFAPTVDPVGTGLLRPGDVKPITPPPSPADAMPSDAPPPPSAGGARPKPPTSKKTEPGPAAKPAGPKPAGPKPAAAPPAPPPVPAPAPAVPAQPE